MNTKLLCILIIFLMATSCSTYYMTPQSLQSQLAGHPNGISQIKCVDKDGNAQVLDVTNHIGIRITKKDDSRLTFYLITAYLQDSLIMGSKSAIIEIPITPIKISDIKKIEFQR
jgi:hypothetical protein